MITLNLSQNTSDVKPTEIIDENPSHENQLDLINALRKLGLSGSEVFTYAHLKSIARDKNFLFASHETIAKELGISERTLSRHKARLVSFGLIVLKERWKLNLTTLITIKDITKLTQPHATNGTNVPEIATNVVADNNDLRENDKNGRMNLKALKHDDDDGTSQFFVTNAAFAYDEFVTTTTWGNFEIDVTPLLESVVTESDNFKPLVIIRDTLEQSEPVPFLAKPETETLFEPLVMVIQAIPNPAEPVKIVLAPELRALLDKLPIDPGPMQKKLADVLPQLPISYVEKWVQFYETEIALEKSRFHNPLGFAIQGILATNQNVPPVTKVKEKGKKTSTTTKKAVFHHSEFSPIPIPANSLMGGK